MTKRNLFFVCEDQLSVTSTTPGSRFNLCLYVNLSDLQNASSHLKAVTLALVNCAVCVPVFVHVLRKWRVRGRLLQLLPPKKKTSNSLLVMLQSRLHFSQLKRVFPHK